MQRPKNVLTFGLYGEDGGESGEIWGHVEAIAARSSPYDWSIKLHQHLHYVQILYISSGGGELLTATGAIPLICPCIVIMPAKSIHGFQFKPDVVGHTFTFRASRVAQLLETSPGILAWVNTLGVTRCDGPHAEDIALAADAVAIEHDRRDEVRRLAQESALTGFLVQAYRAALVSGHLPPEMHSDRMRRLQNLINAHFREHQPAGFYADHLALSATQLNRITLAETGQTVSSLLEQRLIAEAKQALAFTMLPVQLIAFHLGFADPAYFSRFFSKNVGRSPITYRQQERI